MTLADWIVLGLVAAVAVVALICYIRSLKKGGCPGCSGGSCPGCRKK